MKNLSQVDDTLTSMLRSFNIYISVSFSFQPRGFLIFRKYIRLARNRNGESRISILNFLIDLPFNKFLNFLLSSSLEGFLRDKGIFGREERRMLKSQACRLKEKNRIERKMG